MYWITSSLNGVKSSILSTVQNSNIRPIKPYKRSGILIHSIDKQAEAEVEASSLNHIRFLTTSLHNVLAAMFNVSELPKNRIAVGRSLALRRCIWWRHYKFACPFSLKAVEMKLELLCFL